MIYVLSDIECLYNDLECFCIFNDTKSLYNDLECFLVLMIQKVSIMI